jgi:hypothetical protein
MSNNPQVLAGWKIEIGSEATSFSGVSRATGNDFTIVSQTVYLHSPATKYPLPFDMNIEGLGDALPVGCEWNIASALTISQKTRGPVLDIRGSDLVAVSIADVKRS